MHREQIDAALAAQLVAEQFPHWAHLPVSPVAFSGYGRIKLGGPDDKPEFSNFAWFAMLFQAGMGIGLVFWGVAEPVWHYGDPPLGLAAPRTPQTGDC